MNGKTKGLSERNTCIICDTDERGSELGENLRLSSLKFAYSRLFSLNGRKNVEVSPLISRAAALGLRLAGRRRAGSDRRFSQTLAMCVSAARLPVHLPDRPAIDFQLQPGEVGR
jgi:hypothetical protein